MKRLLLLSAVCAGACTAQPFIYSRGIVNSASSLPYGIPAGTIARGSIFTIYGRNLGLANGTQATSYPLNNTLGNVSITVSDGRTTLNALPTYVSATQLSAIMPSTAPLGTVSVRVTFNNSRSNSVPVRVGANSPGLYSVRGTGVGPGVIQNYVAADNQPVNSNQAPATPGQTEIMWGTGLGAVVSDSVAPAAANLPVTVEVFVGGIAAQTAYSGRAPCCAGSDQIVFQVPPNAPSGCWVPVYARVAGSAVSNVVTMAITPDGSPCSTGETQAGSTLIQGGKIGLLAPLRSDIRQTNSSGNLDLRTDFLMARFGQEKGGPFAFNPLFSLPPGGTCTAYSGAGDWFTADAVPDENPEVRTLAAGSITVSGGGRKGTFNVPFSPLTLGYLGSSNPAIPASSETTVLGPGSFTIQSAGGNDIAAFNVPFTMISPLTWANRDQISTVDRSAGFTVNWTGGDGLSVAVVGGNVDLPTNASGVFVCMAAPGSNSITVPAAMLSNLPPGRGSPHYSKGIVYLVGAGGLGTFSAGGLDNGLVGPVYLSGKAVSVK